MAIVAGVGITAIGQGAWGLMVIANLRLTPQAPWCVPAMALILTALIAWLGGRGWPRSTSLARRSLLRWNPMPWPVFAWALLAGALCLVCLSATWLVVADLVRLAPNITPQVRGYPALTIGAIFVMGCIAAPLAEEAAFRGYAMGLLEGAWRSAPVAIVGSSVLFALIHLTQGVDPAKLGLYLFAGLIFAAIAWLTNSLYAAMVVHSAADVVGFTILWPVQSAPHALIWDGGASPTFWRLPIAAVLFAALGAAALVRLERITRPLRASALADMCQVRGRNP
jgi:hypothetical protein